MNRKTWSKKAIWPEAQMWIFFKRHIKKHQWTNCSISAILPNHLIYVFTGPRLTHWVSLLSRTQSKGLIKPKSAPQNNTCCMQLRRSQTQVIGVVLSSLTNQPQTPKRHAPTFATVNKTTLLAKHFHPVARTLCSLFRVSTGVHQVHLLNYTAFYRFDDSNMTNPVIISSLKAFNALFYAGSKIGIDFHSPCECI